MTANVLIIPEPLVDFDDCNDFSEDLFDPLPLDAQNDDDLLSLSDVMDVLRSPKRAMHHRRRVSFEDQPTEISVPSFACLGETERRNLWYRSVEIERFRTVARHACRTLRKNPGAYPADITRGLELRTSQDRQYRKHLALNCILKAQWRFPKIDPLDLARIADRCTALPRQEALEQGNRDFCDAYCAPPLPPTFTPNLKRSPSVVSCEEEPLAKRQRFMPDEEPFPLF